MLSIPRTKELFTRCMTPSTTIMEPQETFIDKVINLVYEKIFIEGNTVVRKEVV
jgi:hypothetical protein